LIFVSWGWFLHAIVAASGADFCRMPLRMENIMNRRTILFLLSSDTPDNEISAAAEAAAQDQNHLRCLLLAAAPSLPFSAFGVPPYGGMNIPDNWGELVTESREKLNARVQAIEALLAKSNVSGDVQSAMCVTIDIKHHVARAARVSDEVHFSDSLRDTPDFLREAASGVLFHSPVAFRLNGTPGQHAKRVFVAWDSSTAAASAVHAALPYLKEAKEVVIACIDPTTTDERDGRDPGTDVAAWLSHHGCKVTVSQYPSGGQRIEQCIMDRALEFGADLVVMGAYGHSRMVQAVFGGTTRAMVEQTKLPVLLAH
jgi:nucleotide-binding universal stress UspA family protein